MRNVMLIGLLFFGLAANTDAKTLKNGGYSLDFPAGWAVVKKGPAFSAAHPDGSSFDAIPAELPENITSVEVAALMSRATAMAVGFCGGKASDFELAANGWVGSGFHCNNRPAQGKPASETIGLTVKHGNKFYHFFLFVPRQDWDSNRQQYLSLFKSLRFRS